MFRVPVTHALLLIPSSATDPIISAAGHGALCDDDNVEEAARSGAIDQQIAYCGEQACQSKRVCVGHGRPLGEKPIPAQRHLPSGTPTPSGACNRRGLRTILDIAPISRYIRFGKTARPCKKS